MGSGCGRLERLTPTRRYNEKQRGGAPLIGERFKTPSKSKFFKINIHHSIYFSKLGGQV